MKEELTMTETAGTEILEESVKSQDIRWYENVQYDDAKLYIRAHITSAARNFISIGYYLKYVRDHGMYMEDGHKDIWEFAWSEYGISKSTASRYMSMNDRFSKDGNCPYVKEEYKEFGKSQLQEMLSLTEEQLEQVSPADRVEDIRSIRKPRDISIPYVELPGQHELEVDFADCFPDIQLDPLESEQPPDKQVFEMSVEDLVEADAIAISQQKVEPETHAIDFKTLDKIIDMVKQRPETEEQVPDESWNIGDLPQAKERHVKLLAQLFTEKKRVQLIAMPGKGEYLSDESIREKVEYFSLENDNSIDLGDGVEAWASAELIEFYSGGEELGVCSYARFATQVRKAMEARRNEEPVVTPNEVPAQEVTELDMNSCPPGNSSCRRQEWGTDLEQQKAGHEECKKCWQDWKKLKAVLSTVPESHVPEAGQAVDEEEEELEVPVFTAGNRNIDSGGAYGVTWAAIVGAYLSELNKRGLQPVSEGVSAISVQAMGHECLVEPGYNAEFWRNDNLWFKVEWQRLQQEYEYFYPDKPKEEPEQPEPIESVVIDAEYTEIPEPEKKPEEEYTLEYFLKEQNQKLKEMLEGFKDCEPDKVPRKLVERQKMIVCALAAMKADLEIEEFKRTYKPEQPILSVLKNNDQRKAFIDAYVSWPLWIDQKETGERYYRYNLSEKVAIVVKVSWKHSWSSYKESKDYEYGTEQYYLLGIKSQWSANTKNTHVEDDTRTFYECSTNMSTLVDYLKEFQKKG